MKKKDYFTSAIGAGLAVMVAAMVAFLIVTTVQDCRAGEGVFMSRAKYWGYQVEEDCKR